MLAETIEREDVRSNLLDSTVAAAGQGARLGAALREWLATLPPAELAERLIGGVAFDELPFDATSLSSLARRGDFVLAPLSNHLFTRDTSAWIYDGVCVNHMAKPARVREALRTRLRRPPVVGTRTEGELRLVSGHHRPQPGSRRPHGSRRRTGSGRTPTTRSWTISGTASSDRMPGCDAI